MGLKEGYYRLMRILFNDAALTSSIILSIIFIAYALLPLFLSPNAGLYSFYYGVSRVIVWILISLVVLYIIFKWRVNLFYNSLKARKVSGKHLSIVIVKYDLLHKSVFYLLIRFKELFHTLKENNIPFEVCLVNDKHELINAIDDKNVHAIMIFGHGIKHGIKFSDYTYLYYCEVPRLSHIKYLGQFHCNHFAGKSLDQYIGCEGKVTDDIVISHEINDYIQSKLYVQKFKKIFGVKK